MRTLAHWLAVNGGILAVLVTGGVALLVVCGLACTNCRNREKDDLFHRHEI